MVRLRLASAGEDAAEVVIFFAIAASRKMSREIAPE